MYRDACRATPHPDLRLAPRHSAFQDKQIRLLDFRQGLDAKVPTSILVELAPPHKVVELGPDVTDKYVEGTHAIFHRYKMQLHDQPDKKTIRADIGDIELPTEVVFARALEIMKQKVLDQAASRGMPFSTLSTLWVLTVPAIWTAKAKQMMRHAAYKAGLIASEASSQLMLALEPECAALQAHVDSQVLRQGYKYAILDCGGGTIDTTAYVIDGIAPLNLREIHRATGGGWGSTYIDRELIKVLRSIFGNPRCLEQGQMALFDFLTNVWEAAKVRISQENLDNPDYRLSINVMAITDELDDDDFDLGGAIKRYNARHPSQAPITKYGARNIRLPRDVINAIFHPALSKIEGHVKSLLRKLPALDYIVIVGGFGSSDVLQNTVRKAVAASRTQVVTVDKASLAIVMGAVRFGLDPRVVRERRAKMTYGVRTMTDWEDNGPHPVSRRKWSETRQEYNVHDVRHTGSRKRKRRWSGPVCYSSCSQHSATPGRNSLLVLPPGLFLVCPAERGHQH